MMDPMSESDQGDFVHWLQGGPCDDLHIFSVVELPAEIHMLKVGDTWTRVLPPWPGAVVYRREASVEQIDRERIYYPSTLGEKRA